MTADELRTMPVDTMLMIEATAAPLVLKTKLYFEEKGIAERASIPYHVVHVRQEPARPSPTLRSQGSLPPAPSTGKMAAPPIVVDADLADDEAGSFFQE
jgi:type IV secretory pathway TraG/TraD family ATPase VirD4